MKLEAKGLPTAVICNRSFAALARSTARMLGAAEYQFVVLPTLLSSLSDRQVVAQAREALPAVLAALGQQSE